MRIADQKRTIVPYVLCRACEVIEVLEGWEMFLEKNAGRHLKSDRLGRDTQHNQQRRKTIDQLHGDQQSDCRVRLHVNSRCCAVDLRHSRPYHRHVLLRKLQSWLARTMTRLWSCTKLKAAVIKSAMMEWARALAPALSKSQYSTLRLSIAAEGMSEKCSQVANGKLYDCADMWTCGHRNVDVE